MFRYLSTFLGIDINKMIDDFLNTKYNLLENELNRIKKIKSKKRKRKGRK